MDRIYFDMDGVVADFDRGVLELCHMQPLDQETSTEEDNRLLYAKMCEVSHFYDNLKAIPAGVILLWEMYRRYGTKVGILSGIPKPNRGIDDAKDDKISWCGRYLPKDIELVICYRAEKVERAENKDCYLVDDYSKNIREWEAAGGSGVYCKYVADAVKALKEYGLIDKNEPLITGDENIVEEAARLATLAHEGQKDKAGKPYINHPTAVAAGVETPVEKAVAYMHDVLEDTTVSEADLRALFGDEITDALCLLNHKKSVDYFDYVRNLKSNPVSRAVKLSDLRHNMQIDRIPNPTEKDFVRIKKYEKAVQILTS